MSDLYIEVLFDIVSLDRTFTYRYTDDDVAKIRVGTVVYGRIHGRREKGWITEVGVEPPVGIAIADIDEVSKISIAEDFQQFALAMQHLYGGSTVHYVKLIDSATSRLPTIMVSGHFLQSFPEDLDIRPSSSESSSRYAMEELSSPESRGTALGAAELHYPAGGEVGSIRISPDVSVVDILYSRLATRRSSHSTDDVAPLQLSVAKPLVGNTFAAERDGQPKVSSRILVLYPDFFQLNFDAQRLKNDGTSFLVIDKPLSAKARNLPIDVDVILGTRSAIFAPIVGLALIIVVDPTSAGHRSIPHPRIDSFSIARLRGQLHGVEVVVVSGFPDPTLHQIARPKGNSSDSTSWPNVRVGDITSSSQLINETLIDWIGEMSQASDGPLLLIYNKKGRVNRYICRTCKEVVACEVCEMPLVYGEIYTDDGSTDISPVRRYNFSTARAEEFFDRLNARGLYCPSCHRSTPFACGRCKGTKIRVASMGSLRIADELWGIYANRVIHLDSESKELPDSGIVVGTSMVLNRYRRAAGVALLDVDALASQFGFASINRLYESWFKASRMLVGAKNGAPLYLGVRTADIGYVRAMIDKRPRDLYQYDLSSRRDFSMPPYSFQVKITARRSSAYDFESIKRVFIEIVDELISDNGGESDSASGRSDGLFQRASLYEISDAAAALVASSEDKAYEIIDRAREQVGNSFLLERFFEDL